MNPPEGLDQMPEHSAGGIGRRVEDVAVAAGAIPVYPGAGPRRPGGRRSIARLLPVAILALTLVVAAAGLFISQRGGLTAPAVLPMASALGSAPAPVIGEPAAPALVSMVVDIPQAEIAAVGPGYDAGGAARIDPLTAVNGPRLVALGSKPQLLYIGGEFCPYCAAARWSLLNALSRFGTFSGLRYMRSADNDGNIATFTFARGTYHSPYLDFVMREASDRDRKDLQPLTNAQELLDLTLGHGGVPFIDINGLYALNSNAAGYPTSNDAKLLIGMDWVQIAQALQNATDPITGGTIGSANFIAAAICSQTADRPASACKTPTIRSIEGQLPRKPATGG